MPRLLSSYAANKRVEDGLRRKQEQIRLDYVRATHRYIDETEKLVDDLIQINVRTPSAFESSCPSSATGYHRRNQIGIQQHITQSQFPVTPQANSNTNLYQHNVQNHGGSSEQLALLRSRSRGNLTSDGNTDDGTSISRKDIPLPIVKVHGKDVFYQYENQRSNWKKIEPTYRTKVLLNRNDTVANALKQYALQKAQPLGNNPNGAATTDVETSLGRKNSVMSRGESDVRRASIFSSARRGSRRDSRLSEIDDDDDDRIPPIVELKPQLSPGHTPRMLDGWTIMNWCLWKKKEKKPVWASKRYIDKKNRELKRFQASRAANKNDLPAKPSSANPSTREARRKESLIENPPQQIMGRAKSVPAHRLSMTIEEEDEDENPFLEADRGLLRPTTSILRLRRDTDVSTIPDENRPKTTQTHRRVALDTFTDSPQYDLTDRLPRVNSHIKEKKHTHFESDLADNKDFPHRSKSGFVEGKSVKISEPLKQQNLEDDNIEILDNDNDKPNGILNNSENNNGHKNRISGLAATPITMSDNMSQETAGTLLAKKNSTTLSPINSLVKPAHKMNYTAIHATPVFPKVQSVVPELGSDSPH